MSKDNGYEFPPPPPGVKVKYWGSTEPPRPGGRDPNRARPFGLPNTPFSPSSGKFLSLDSLDDVPPEPDDSSTPTVVNVDNSSAVEVANLRADILNTLNNYINNTTFTETLGDYVLTTVLNSTLANYTLTSGLGAAFASYLTGLSGYSASANQALMNDNGTLKWVTVQECSE